MGAKALARRGKRWGRGVAAVGRSVLDRRSKSARILDRAEAAIGDAGVLCGRIRAGAPWLVSRSAVGFTRYRWEAETDTCATSLPLKITGCLRGTFGQGIRSASFARSSVTP
jgi:hypothetical protein